MSRSITATIRMEFDFTETIEQMISDDGPMTDDEIRDYLTEDLAEGSAVGECLRRGLDQYITVQFGPAANHYASLSWTPDDVLTLAPSLTPDVAEKWLCENQKHIRDRLCELGWDVISTLLAHDGIDTSDED